MDLYVERSSAAPPDVRLTSADYICVDRGTSLQHVAGVHVEHYAALRKVFAISV